MIKSMIKRISALCTVCALVFSLAGCSSSSTDTKDATLYGQVEETGDGTITLLLGEWVTDESESGEMESGDFSADAPSGDGSELPSGEMESGEFDGEIPSQDSTDTDSEDAPAFDEDESAQLPDDAQGDFSGDLPSGGTESDFSGGMQSGISFGSFEAGDETVTLSVSDDLADTLSSLSEGDIVVVVTDSDGTVTSIQTMGASASFGGAASDGDFSGDLPDGEMPDFDTDEDSDSESETESAADDEETDSDTSDIL